MTFTVMSIVWIAVLVAAIVVELMGPALVSIWFAFGALAAAILSAMGFSVIFQSVAFILVSVIALAVTRPVLKKLMPKAGYVPTNGELDIGKTASVIEKTDDISGRVRLGGVDWGARFVGGENISVGDKVIVTEKSGAYLTVKKEGE